MPTRSHLVVLPARGAVRRVALEAQVTRIGSSPEAEVHLPDPDLAAVHARIEVRDDHHVLVREALPLLVNGLRAKTHVLRAGDLIVMGKCAVGYRAGDAASDAQELAGGPARPASDAIARVLRRLVGFAARVHRRGSAGELAGHLLDDLVALTGATRATLTRIPTEGDPVRMATATRGPASAMDVALSQTLGDHLRQRREAILVQSTATDPIVAGAASLVGAAHSAIAVPVEIDGRLVGALYVSAGAFALGLDDVAVIEGYATLAAALIDQQRHTEALEERLTELGETPADASPLIGASAPMRALRERVLRLGRSSEPILVVGAEGTGKGLVAAELHRQSANAGGPLVTVACGGVPEARFASELAAGDEGAPARAGLLASAAGGSLFFDEVADLAPSSQALLLRLVEEVASSASPPRLLFASSRSLDAEVEAGRFRRDLFLRIGLVAIALPTLRERGDDVLLLAEHFLRDHARHAKVSLRVGDDAVAALRSAPLAGNVRELEGRIRRAVLLAEGGAVGAADLGLPAPSRTDEEILRPLTMARDEFLRAYVRRVVDRLGGNRTAAAEALLVTPRTIYRYLEE